jgi:hypothetical protein
MCREAVTDYCNKMGIIDTIIPIDEAGIYWRKTDEMAH